MASPPPPPSPLDKDPSNPPPAASPALVKDGSMLPPAISPVVNLSPIVPSPQPHILPPSSSSGERDDDFRAGSAEFCSPAFKSRPRGKTGTVDSEADLRRLFRLLIRKCTSKKHSKRGHYYAFTYSEVVGVIKAVKKVLIKEPPLIEMKVPCAVIGDLHGQYTDLCRIFDMFRDDKTPGYAMTRYVFLGDYVDRGRQSLEIVMVLFMLKFLYPTQFALLRGNHECRAINKAYGFFAEIKERFLDPKKAVDLFEMFNECFTHLPLACVVADNILCMHGGISSKMKTREDIMKVPKPIKDVSTNQIATDLLWADPMEGLPGEIPNKVRGVSVYFGEATLDQFLADLKIKLVIRGHQMMMNGFNFFHNKLITVFSAAAYYPDKPNRGAVCTIDAFGRVGFQVVIPNKESHPDDKPKLFRGDHDVANEFDTGYVKVAPGVKKPGATQEESSGEKGEKPQNGPIKR